MTYPESVHETIAHFLTAYPHDAPLSKTEDYVRKHMAKRYSQEVVDDTIKKHYTYILSVLIDEHDRRSRDGDLLRYRFVDTQGEIVRGIGSTWAKRFRVFQDAINDLNDDEFEGLSANLLTVLGCDMVWKTPASHDQGLDAFGYAPAFTSKTPREIRSQCRIVYLAQAKHYSKHKVGSRDLREFVGSVELAVHKIFSTVDEKYVDLEIRPFGPCVMVLMTSEEIPFTVKTIGRNAGIVVLSAQDIAMTLSKGKIIKRDRWTKGFLTKDMRRAIRDIRCAQ
jgi:hypothetical protein